MNKFYLKITLVFLFFSQILILDACSTDEQVNTETEEIDNETESQTETTESPKSQIETNVVSNLLSSESATTFQEDAGPIYYSLEENKIIDKNLSQTSLWDIEFVGAFNSSVKANDKNDKSSSGYQGSGTAKIYLYTDSAIEADLFNKQKGTLKRVPERALLDKIYNELSAVPETGITQSLNEIGVDAITIENSWCYYDAGGDLYPDAGRVKEHVVYALPRVIIVKTNKGNYAKIIMQSLYKGNPENPDRNNDPGYLNFKYTIQKNGTKKFTE
ncbi:MAG: HmuY family protein [Tenacibaculum sp.]